MAKDGGAEGVGEEEEGKKSGDLLIPWFFEGRVTRGYKA